MDKTIFKGKFGPLLIAEIGGNHEGDFEYAKSLVKLCIATPVDCIKLQLYTGDSLVNPLESPQRNQHFKKFELSKSQYLELAEMIIAAGKIFTASVWDEKFFEWIDPYMTFYKIGSGDLTAYSLIKRTMQYNKPIVISTGLAGEDEVLDVVNFIQTQDKKYKDKDWLALLQCTSMYPILHSDAHLSVMKKLKELTGLTIGYSDHTIGFKTLAYAVALGAQILEFHFTDTRQGKVFRDHQVSLMPDEIFSLTDEIQFINSIKGSDAKRPLPIEMENGHVESFRRAVYPALDIEANTIIKQEHLVTLRPNHGLDARCFFDLIGKRTKIDLKKHQLLSWEFFL